MAFALPLFIKIIMGHMSNFFFGLLMAASILAGCKEPSTDPIPQETRLTLSTEAVSVQYEAADITVTVKESETTVELLVILTRYVAFARSLAVATLLVKAISISLSRSNFTISISVVSGSTI